MRGFAKNHLINIEMFGSNENQFGDNEKDRKKRDKEDINVLTANSYSYAVIMTYIY